jgi:aspartyl-tRNA(Asn)/glutamyl-tRNA(Gln) amidotransferase subunit A
MTDLTQATASELSDLYQSGAVSPVTVAEQVLAKIERVNPVLNAFCFTDPDTTMSQARASEQRWKNGQPLSELDGVPVAVKDSILTQGWPTLQGSRAISPDQPWLEDAPAVARLREAGAVFVGKTTVPEFAWDRNNTFSQANGVTANPWNTKCSTGGSSGGSAVSVAANLVPVAIGTDMGGSITVPGSFCGVFGYKPSASKVAHSPRDALNLSTPGVFAKSTVDLITTINIISQPDLRDWFHTPSTKITTHPDSTPRSLNIGLLADIQDIINYVELGLIFDKIQNLWKTQSVTLDVQRAKKIFYNVSQPTVLHRWQNLTQEQKLLTEKRSQKTAMLATQVDSDLYYWLTQRVNFGASINQYINKFDAIVVPATIISAANVEGDSVPVNISPWSTLCAVVGLPSVTVPVGVDAQGLPIAIMVIGSMHGDALVLQVAQVIQKQFPMPACPVIL